MTIGSAAALPLYVMMRSSVGKALELAPAAAAREAVLTLDAARVRRKRLGSRILLAVVGPVAFVALGASLLVHAPARKQEIEARRADAGAFVRGVLELAPTETPPRGRHDAAVTAAGLGYQVEAESLDRPESGAMPAGTTPAPAP